MNRHIALAQAALNRAMNTNLVVDGLFGPATRRALITYSRLRAQPLHEYEQGEIGSGVNRQTPEYIRWYQSSLNKILPTTLSVDGRDGTRTRAAVMAFQRRSKLKPDGKVGAQTEAALIKAGAPSPPGASAPGRQGRTFVTKFHPGVSHNHQPTNRWSDIQSDARTRCLSPTSSEGFVSDCACAIGSPQTVADTINNTLMLPLPLAKKHFNHYLSGGGANLMVDLEEVIRNDSGVRGKLASNIKARSVGHFKITQSDYASKDFQFAFGAIDRLDYEADRASGQVHIWFQDRYEWHPVGFGYKRFPDDGRREDNCVHAAMVELKNSGARDYWMIGDAVIPISMVTAGAPGGGRSSSISLESWRYQ
jgi:hypothetical protein